MYRGRYLCVCVSNKVLHKAAAAAAAAVAVPSTEGLS